MSEISIAGSGVVSASPETVYESVSIAGLGTVSGFLNCEKISISGIGNIDAKTHCTGRITISGSARFMNLTEADEISTSGFARFEKDVKSREIKIAGESRFSGDVEALEIRVSGIICGQNVNAEDVKISGGATISGLLNAEKINIKLDDKCNINEIGCADIIVKKKNMNYKKNCHLISRTIEGDSVVLAFTRAETVRGKNVVIGEGSEIDRVEYSDTLTVADSAKVKEQIKV